MQAKTAPATLLRAFHAVAAFVLLGLIVACSSGGRQNGALLNPGFGPAFESSAGREEGRNENPNMPIAIIRHLINFAMKIPLSFGSLLNCMDPFSNLIIPVVKHFEALGLTQG